MHHSPTGNKKQQPAAIRITLIGVIIRKMAATIHDRKTKRVLMGCVQIRRWYSFSIMVKEQLTANSTSVAPESVFFIWLTGVFTILINADVSCYT